MAARRYVQTGFSIYLNMSKQRDILNHMNAAPLIWDEWLEVGFNPTKPLEIDFDFYSTNKKKATEFYNFLNEFCSKISMTERTTLLIFKGWDINASIENIWSLEDLKNIIAYIGVEALKFDTNLEGYGALISSKNK